MITSSALFTENLYRHLVPGRPPAHYIGASRVASVLVVTGGLGFAYWLPSLVKGLEIWLAIPVMLGVAFWLGLFWRRMTAVGAWACALFGFGTWFLTTRPEFVEALSRLPYAGSLGLVWVASGRPPEVYEPWSIALKMAASLAAGVVFSLLSRPTDPERLDRFHALVRTPTQPGEQVQLPCTLPPGTVVPQRRMLLHSLGIEVPMPSRTSLAGFAVGWVLVGVLIGGFVWFVG
jgi:Na+/proline symporter